MTSPVTPVTGEASVEGEFHVLLEAWGDDSTPRYVPHRDSCTICDHPTGDCTEEDHKKMASKTDEKKSGKQESKDDEKSEVENPQAPLGDPQSPNATVLPQTAGTPRYETVPVDKAGEADTWRKSVVQVGTPVAAGEQPEAFTVSEEVLEDVEIAGTKRPTQRVKYAKGQVITAEEAKEAGLR